MIEEQISIRVGVNFFCSPKVKAGTKIRGNLYYFWIYVLPNNSICYLNMHVLFNECGDMVYLDLYMTFSTLIVIV